MIHCLFEQSGTFKNAFKKLGYEAVDYDIENQFNQTDFVVDIFDEIDKFADDKENIFDNMKAGELVFAFFPCTYFSTQAKLIARCDSYSMKNWTIEQKYRYAGDMLENRYQYFGYLLCFISICYILDLKLIIENPYHDNYLLDYLPRTYEMVKIKNRTKLGDDFIKPTIFLFFNHSPKFSIYNDIETKCTKFIKKTNKIQRSLMTSKFAENFIKNFIEL